MGRARRLGGGIVGGYGPRRKAGDTTPTGRRRKAPALSLAAAAAIKGALLERGARAGLTSLTAAARLVLADVEVAAAARAACARFGSKEAARLAGQWLAHFQEGAGELEAGEAKRRAALMVNVLGKNASAATGDIGLAPVAPSGAGFHELAAEARAGGAQHEQRLPSDKLSKRLRRAGFDAAGLRGVIVPVRACARVERWRRKQARPTGRPPAGLLADIVREHNLRAAVASRADQYFMLPEWRFAAPAEIAVGAFGVRVESPLLPALRRATAQQAGSIMGRALVATVARRIVEHIFHRGWLPVPTASAPLRYASACSGADLFAEGVAQACGADCWRYVHAAERRDDARRVLSAAWGLAEDDIFQDAGSAAAGAAAEVDLFAYTPECGQFSRRLHGRGPESVATGAMQVHDTAAFVRARRARVVAIENVAERDAVEAIDAVLARLGGYRWYSQRLDACLHGGVEQDRERHVWVGVLKVVHE